MSIAVQATVAGPAVYVATWEGARGSGSTVSRGVLLDALRELVHMLQARRGRNAHDVAAGLLAVLGKASEAAP